VVVVVGAILMNHVTLSAFADDYDYVKEVLEENTLHDDFYNSYAGDLEVQTHQEELIHRQQEAESRQLEKERQKADEERLARLAAEKIQREKDSAFERELASMNEVQQKLARKLKRLDSRVVHRVLEAAHLDNLYGVLGLRNWEIKVPARQIRIGSFVFRIPGFSLFHVSTHAIRKAYRALSRSVHPDKNRDARAEAAFIAVENAASMLADDSTREVYDQVLWESRRQLRNRIAAVVKGGLGQVLKVVCRAIAIFRAVLGPFAFPVFVLVSLLV
jgi:DnaJ domain